MAKNISLPDGRTLSLTGNETPEQLSALKEKLRTKYKTAQPAAEKKEPSMLESIDAFGRGMSQYTSLGFDPELRSLGRSLATGKPWEDTYKEVQSELSAQQAENPTAYGAGEITGGIASSLVASPASSAKTFLGRTAQQAAYGGALSGATGVGQEEGDLYQRLKTGGEEAVKGALISGGISAGLEGLTKTAKAGYKSLIAPKTDKAAVEALLAEGAPMTAGQVSGGAPAALEGASAQMFTGQGLREMGEKQGKYIEAQASGLFKDIKTPSTMEGAGDTIIRGLNKSSQRFINRKNKLYEGALKNIPDDTPFLPQKSLQIVSDYIQEGKNNLALQKLISAPEFKTIDDALSGNVTIGQAKKSLKKSIWDLAAKYEKDQPNLSRQFKDVYFAIDEDILNSVQAIDPAAASKLKVADAYMSARMKDNESLRKVFDPSKGANETAAKAYYKAVGMAADKKAADSKTLSLLKKHIPKEEFDEFRSFLFTNLGKETAGQAGVEINVIPRKFLTDYNNLTKESKDILLSKPQKAALDKLAQYADIVSPVTLNKSGSAAAGIELGGVAVGTTLTNPWFLTIPVGNYLYGKSYNTRLGKAFVRAINSLPRDIMTQPPSPKIRAIIRGAILANGGTEQDAEELDRQFEQPQNQE